MSWACTKFYNFIITNTHICASTKIKYLVKYTLNSLININKSIIIKMVIKLYFSLFIKKPKHMNIVNTLNY